MKLQRLFTPIRIGSMTVKNRLVMPPMDTNLGSPDGFVTSSLVDYYEERARGGVGLIIVECTSVDYPRGKVTRGQISIDDDKYLDGLSGLAQAIKKGGARAAIQLEHGGGVTHSAISGHQPVGPSETISPLGEPVRELTVGEIEELVKRHAEAAARARKAGFDGIEIHGAHEHLLAQFLSPSINRREDLYGGSLENRARFLLEVIRACRAEVGPDFPLWCRIDSAEYGVDPAIDYAQAVKVACWAEEAGVNALHVSGHGYGTQFVALCPGMPGFHLVGASEVKKNVKIPVIAVGRINPELGEWAISERMADMIAMGRALIADPCLPRKAAEGRLEDIAPCIGCWECVEGSIQAVVGALMDPESTAKGELTCSVNPATGRERECVIGKAPAPKRVVVVGGGPAGMEAARVARLRGHDVTLIEKNTQLGGQLIAAAAPPHKEAISYLIDYFRTQLDKLGVTVQLGREAAPADISAAKPDVVIWAAGASPQSPGIPGEDGANIVFASDVLGRGAPVGETVTVIGAETVGGETASFLADQGKKVILVRRGPQILARMGVIVQMRLQEELAAKNVEILTGVTYEGFNRDGLTVRTESGELRDLLTDTYILATGARSNEALIPDLRKQFDNVYVIGDALEPRRIKEAITEGFDVAQRI